MLTPKIDPRNFKSLLEEKRNIVPLYTPEWDAADDRDNGVALLKIFTHMQEEIINRLNKMPEKNFTAFLEMIGLKLMPAQPAKAPVTFYLPENLSGGVFIPAGTKVTVDETDKHKVINFETINGIFATSAAIEHIYGVDPDNDIIHRYTDDFVKGKEFVIFKTEGTKEEANSNNIDSYPNKQEHILYLGHKELFDLKNPATIELQFDFKNGSVEELKNFIWEYWGESDKPIPIDSSEIRPVNNNGLSLPIRRAIEEKEINGVKTRWIGCRSDKVSKSLTLPSISKILIQKVELPTGKTVRPDNGFFNQVPLALNNPGKFYIFGQQPRLFDTFYIASREAFSKRNAKIKITFVRNKDKNENPDAGNRTFSWEYWNGKIWSAFSPDDKLLNNFVADNTNDYSRSIEFDCPANIEEIEVNGEKNYWIRVRLIEGDYGQNKFVPEGTGECKNWVINSTFNPPVINEINIHYSTNRITELHQCLSRNNLEYHDLTQKTKDGTEFKLFTSLPEKYPTLYIGFKDAFKKGNISIFFSLDDMDYTLEARQKIKWTYWSKAPNLIENTTDSREITLASTVGINSGTELHFEETIGVETITETASVDSPISNKIIKLKEKLSYKFTKSALVFKRSNLEATDNTKYLTTTGTLEFTGPPDQSKTHKFGLESYWLMGEFIKPCAEEQLIKGIYPNTVWAEQVETIKDEILGSGDGEKNKIYSLFRVPVISPEIWIRHEDIISEYEEDTPDSEDIQEIKDDRGKTIEKWIRWKIVEDFSDSGSRSRHYTIDSAMGMVQFGDGEHGMIPPIGQDNIKATYKTGGGVLGNVAVNEIKTLKSSIAGIDHITNHEPAEGGSDTELLSEIFERGPHLIKHRDRAVTKEDFERLAEAASSYIARTKCVIKENKLTVIVIPKGEEDKPEPSKGLVDIVKKSLLERSLNMIQEETLMVKGPYYKEIKVKIDVIPESIYQAIPLEKTILKKLKDYLHPLTGGNEGTGWEFGRDVHISDIYALLESIKGVDYVENLTLNSAYEDVSIEEYEIVCSGEHEITMKFGR